MELVKYELNLMAIHVPEYHTSTFMYMYTDRNLTEHQKQSVYKWQIGQYQLTEITYQSVITIPALSHYLPISCNTHYYNVIVKLAKSLIQAH